MVCKCGTPIGGRKKKGIEHYYCPLPERRFNNNYKMDIICDMKRCLNIPTTDTILWNKIVDILSNTIELKKQFQDKTLMGKSLKSRDLKIEVKTREVRIIELTKTKSDLEKGLVEIETNKVLNYYPSIEVYKSLKRDLIRRYNQTKSLIEDISNSLRHIGHREMWFDWIDKFGNYINNQRCVPDSIKKELLKTVLDLISVDYDHKEKVHRLYIHFKIPVVTQDGGKTGNSGNCDKYLISRPQEITDNQIGQLNPVENYSTVTDFARFLGWSTLQLRMTAI
jgi:mRNA-degrading endonuclease YafQ of YafQ-DinJ toxin-antitoxin module